MKKKISGKRPVMFYQDGNGKVADPTRIVLCGPRIRIFYPDGTVEWSPLGNHPDAFEGQFEFDTTPCWLYMKELENNLPKNAKEAIALAEEYDERYGFPKMIFLGEL